MGRGSWEAQPSKFFFAVGQGVLGGQSPPGKLWGRGGVLRGTALLEHFFVWGGVLLGGTAPLGKLLGGAGVLGAQSSYTMFSCGAGGSWAAESP